MRCRFAASHPTAWRPRGHPDHPSVVCRQPVEDGGKRRIDMGILCEASDEECERLARAFEDLNQRMLEQAERQRK